MAFFTRFVSRFFGDSGKRRHTQTGDRRKTQIAHDIVITQEAPNYSGEA